MFHCRSLGYSIRLKIVIPRFKVELFGKCSTKYNDRYFYWYLFSNEDFTIGLRHTISIDV